MIEPAKMSDVVELANNMRANDRKEILEWTAQTPYWAAERSFVRSDIVFSGRAPDGTLLTMFGAARDNLIEETAIIWSLSTEAVRHNRLHFVRNSKSGFEAIAKAMPDVEQFHNFVSLDYTGAIRWIEMLGAGLSSHEPVHGICGGRFAEFWIMNPYYKGGKTICV